VVFEKGSPPLPEGTRVRIEPVEIETEESRTPTLAERLEPVIGTAQGLPSDMAAQHDHYLHGLPKR
jgi:hypothetical protein